MLEKRKVAILLNLALVMMEIISFIMCIPRSGFLSIFLFYTRFSNLLVGLSSICLLAYLFKTERNSIPHWIIMLRYMGTMGVMLTFIIVLLVLAPMQGGYYRMVISGEFKFHHLICPLVSLTSFLFFEDIDKNIDLKDNLKAVIPTFVYASVLVILNIADIVDGPYPFLRVKKQPVWASFTWAIAILGVCYISGFVIRKSKVRLFSESLY